MKPVTRSNGRSQILQPGTLVAGFRIERVIGRSSRGIVYEATQLSLGRRLALKLFDGDLSGDPEFIERFRRQARLQAALDHPAVVAVHEAGESEHGLFLAMQLVHGTTLAEIQRTGAMDDRRVLRLLRQVAEALDAAHGTDLAHGDVASRNVLVDGSDRAYVGGFGVSKSTSPRSDRVAFAAMVDECLAIRGRLSAAAEEPTATSIVDRAERELHRRRRGRQLLLGAVIPVLVAAAAVVVFSMRSNGRSHDAPPAPAVAKGMVPLGSDLLPGVAASVDCKGGPATGASPDCTVVQTALTEGHIEVTRAGAIRSWAVREARGALALQVVRGSRKGYYEVTRSQLELVPDEGVHVFATDLQIEPGDMVGIYVSPGALIGVRSASGATTSRWFRSLRAYRHRALSLGAGTGFDFEMLVRADYLPGARRRFPHQLTGSEAAGALPGLELRSGEVELASGVLFRVAAMKVEGRVVLDLFRKTRRIARIAVPDADSRGELLVLEAITTPLIPSGQRLEWRNPDGRVITHEYAIGPRSFRLIS